MTATATIHVGARVRIVDSAYPSRNGMLGRTASPSPSTPQGWIRVRFADGNGEDARPLTFPPQCVELMPETDTTI